MRCSYFVALAAVLSGVVAMTAVSAQAEDQFKWTGFYIGANAGGSSGNSSMDFTASQNGPCFNCGDLPLGLSGGLAGGHIGYQQQVGALVLGLEGSYDWSSIKGSQNADNRTIPRVDEVNVSSLATINARVGVANGRWLGYATGGWATADVTANESRANRFDVSGKAQHSGWDAGGGLEYAATNSVVVGIEYTHVDLGTASHQLDFSPRVFDVFDVHSTLDVVKGRLSWKIN